MFAVCNRCESSPSLTILVPLWFLIISFVFLYLNKLPFSGFRQFKVILYAAKVLLKIPWLRRNLIFVFPGVLPSQVTQPCWHNIGMTLLQQWIACSRKTAHCFFFPQQIACYVSKRLKECWLQRNVSRKENASGLCFVFFLILEVATHWGTCCGYIKRHVEATLPVVAKNVCRGDRMFTKFSWVRIHALWSSNKMTSVFNVASCSLLLQAVPAVSCASVCLLSLPYASHERKWVKWRDLFQFHAPVFLIYSLCPCIMPLPDCVPILLETRYKIEKRKPSALYHDVGFKIVVENCLALHFRKRT